ncbi:M23 family metallopeptidase [Variovorax boronicumulans]|uniref:M23 family metallopeptidase n=1 Tax=Variovorax boronicumulans TaxID=436515 RepID=UPI003395C43B
MIISPPFLSLSDIPVYDGQCVSNVMPGGIVGSGAYPVSQAMGWHGGIHIHAPTNLEPVRAIADGTVVFRRDAGNARYDNEDHSTGCVVIRHVTEIGAQGTAPVTVTYYSITQHLRQLDRELPAVGRAIYRKDRLGLAGTIHGESDRVHLEIVAGDADTLKLVGRVAGELAVGGNGRTDAVYGQMYVLVPAKSPCFSAQPVNASMPAAAGDSGNDDLIIGIRYEAGGATLTTYKLNGGIVGTAPLETDAEYNLYTEANTRHRRLSAADQLISSPSGWYELLRFGRNLGSDPLPANAAHWRKVVVPGQPGGVWINLNAANTRKFSDADFPHWAGWKLIDDDVNDDNSRCDSALINAMLNSPPQPGATAVLTPAQKAADRMQNLCKSDVQEKLAKTICKFPTEWAKDEVRKRWAWTRETGNPSMPYPLEDETDFTEMTDFAQKLCFWEELPAEDKSRLTIKPWHFHPREFIKHFRKCGWLSEPEFKQLLPQFAMRLDRGRVLLWEPIRLNGNRNATIANHRIPLNRALLKWGIDTPLRKATFFGNSIQETQWWALLAEGSGSTLWYAPWYGRGFLQLTNPENYIGYWKYRGRIVPEALRVGLVAAHGAVAGMPLARRSNLGLQDANFPALTLQMREWRSHVGADMAGRSSSSEDLIAPADSAGYYWAKNRMSAEADAVHVLEHVPIQTDQGIKAYYRSRAFWRASATVNLPGVVNRINYTGINGFDARCVAYGYALAVLAEIRFPNAAGSAALDFPDANLPRR